MDEQKCIKCWCGMMKSKMDIFGIIASVFATDTP